MKPKIRLTSNVGVVVDGNSIANGLHPFISSSKPVLGSGCKFTAVQVSGQTWSDMSTSAADVDAALSAAGDFCILLLLEHTNQLNSGSTVGETWDKMRYYIDGRRAVRPDVRIGIGESIPRASFNATYNTLESLNTKLQEIDEKCWALASQNDWMFISTRVPGSPYRFTSFDAAAFDATQPYWSEGTGAQTHPTPAGYQFLSREFSAALHRMSAR